MLQVFDWLLGQPFCCHLHRPFCVEFHATLIVHLPFSLDGHFVFVFNFQRPFCLHSTILGFNPYGFKFTSWTKLTSLCLSFGSSRPWKTMDVQWNKRKAMALRKRIQDLIAPTQNEYNFKWTRQVPASHPFTTETRPRYHHGASRRKAWGAYSKVGGCRESMVQLCEVVATPLLHRSLLNWHRSTKRSPTLLQHNSLCSRGCLSNIRFHWT